MIAGIITSVLVVVILYFLVKMTLSTEDVDKATNAEPVKDIATAYEKPSESFTKEQLVSFGNYLLSDERDELTDEECKKGVTDSDLYNWMSKN